MPEISASRLAPMTSLRDKALEILRQAIVTGQIEPGELYSATALAKELGVSVSPVREAMLTLVNEGTLEAVRNRGFRIVELSQQDLVDVFELRLMLEVPSVGDLARMNLEAWQDDLERLVVATENTVADATEFLARDRDFHLYLLGLRGNQRLLDMVTVLRDHTRLYGLGDGANQQLRVEAADEHRRLVAKILSHDDSGAERVMRQHLEHVQREWYLAAAPERQEA